MAGKVALEDNFAPCGVIRALALISLTALAAAGCARVHARPDLAPPRQAKPTEEETRDAYLNTPVIVNHESNLATPGITRERLFKALGGGAALGYPRKGGRQCVVYPIIGTQVWDRYGVPVAAEWEFCFRHDRLVSKRRLEVGQ